MRNTIYHISYYNVNESNLHFSVRIVMGRINCVMSLESLNSKEHHMYFKRSLFGKNMSILQEETWSTYIYINI